MVCCVVFSSPCSGVLPFHKFNRSCFLWNAVFQHLEQRLDFWPLHLNVFQMLNDTDCDKLPNIITEYLSLAQFDVFQTKC